MTDIKFKVGPVSGHYKTYSGPLTSIKPCTPVIKTIEKIFGEDKLVSLHADKTGKVSATKVWPTEDGRLVDR